jgi:MraZ protein
MFRGHFEFAVDDKGRVAVPIPFREALSGLEDERLVATKFWFREYHCLDVYPVSGWKVIEDRLRAMDPFDEDVVSFCKLYVAPAQELPLDSLGRILLPPLLREHAGIKRDVTITGNIDKFRIWDRQVWQQVLREDEDQVPDAEEFLASLDLDSVVTEVIDRLGGILICAGTARVSVETIHQARRRGFFLHAQACIRLARALAPGDPVAQLAWVERLAGLS